jgi:hypothetical protein
MKNRTEMTAQDRQGLMSYLQSLRTFYGIPADQPVFPPLPKAPGATDRPRPIARATGRNGADHPWRKS